MHVQSTDDSMLVQGMRDIQYELKLPPAFPPEVEAAVLAPQVGVMFDGAIVEVATTDPTRGRVTLRGPARIPGRGRLRRADAWHQPCR